MRIHYSQNLHSSSLRCWHFLHKNVHIYDLKHPCMSKEFKTSDRYVAYGKHLASPVIIKMYICMYKCETSIAVTLTGLPSPDDMDQSAHHDLQNLTWGYIYMLTKLTRRYLAAVNSALHVKFCSVHQSL